MKNRHFTKWFLCFIAASLLGVWIGFHFYSNFTSSKLLDRYVTNDPCKNHSIHDTCYFDAMEEVFKKAGFKTALAYVKEITKDQPYDSCHFFMHEIGKFAYREYRDIRRVLNDADYFYCLGGFTHGALAEYLADSQDLEGAVAEVCIPFLQKRALDQRARDCLHGLGHSLMTVTENDIFKSIRYCDLYPEGEKQFHCHYGAFMENYYEHKPDYHGPIKFIDRDDPLYPCNAVDEKYKSACYRFSGYIAITEYQKEKPKSDWDIEGFKVAIAACEKINEERETDMYQEFCVGNLPAMIQGTFKYPENFGKIKQLCALANKDSHEARCLAVFARILSRIDYEKRDLASLFCQEVGLRFRDHCVSFIEREQ